MLGVLLILLLLWSAACEFCDFRFFSKDFDKKICGCGNVRRDGS